ncbi:MAG TPA: hypothetical protein VHR39_18330 [Propionibacteriaceae bacterium]|jgi:hypothetical protein|nr:hypothetical protein [Propionibacteriaceae bacterium]
MARVSGEILIERLIEEVFDFVADQRNEPIYNPRLRPLSNPRLRAPAMSVA